MRLQIDRNRKLYRPYYIKIIIIAVFPQPCSTEFYNLTKKKIYIAFITVNFKVQITIIRFVLTLNHTAYVLSEIFTIFVKQFVGRYLKFTRCKQEDYNILVV